MLQFPNGHRVMVTGHRTLPNSSLIQNVLSQVLFRLALKKPEGINAISGMALGTDTIFAKIAIQQKIPLIAAVPTSNQADRWPDADVNNWRNLLTMAHTVIKVWEEPGYETADFVKALHRRNEWMVDHADTIIAVWSGLRSGGTWHCMRYAHRQGKSILVIDATSGDIRISHPST